MRIKKISWLVVVGLTSLLAASPTVCAKTINQLGFQSESKLWLTGNSTFHAYKSTATKIDYVVDLKRPLTPASKEAVKEELRKAIQNHQLKRLDVNVPVAGLKSGSRGLDKNMHKLLLGEEHPSIHFHLTRYQARPLPGREGFLIETLGELSLAGVTRTVSLESEAEWINDGLRIRGEKEFLMSDYGIEPPVLLAGVLKTDDQVIIHYDIFLNVEHQANHKETP